MIFRHAENFIYPEDVASLDRRKQHSRVNKTAGVLRSGPPTVTVSPYNRVSLGSPLDIFPSPHCARPLLFSSILSFLAQPSRSPPMSKALGTTEDPKQETRVVSGITSTAASTLDDHDVNDTNGDITRAPSATHHVDVAEAKEDFAALQRHLSKTSLQKAREAGDVEKGDPNEEFDLREYFTSSNEANEQSGIRRKNVGVSWNDLSVQVVDTGFKVCTFRSRHIGNMGLMMDHPCSGFCRWSSW